MNQESRFPRIFESLIYGHVVQFSYCRVYDILELISYHWEVFSNLLAKDESFNFNISSYPVQTFENPEVLP